MPFLGRLLPEHRTAADKLNLSLFIVLNCQMQKASSHFLVLDSQYPALKLKKPATLSSVSVIRAINSAYYQATPRWSRICLRDNTMQKPRRF